MYGYLLVALGGAIGSVLRFGASNLIAKLAGDSFPWGTIVVNISGSLLIGLLAALATLNTKITHDARFFTTHFLIVGICGGYTTFSSFSLQTFKLLQAREWLAAGGNVVLSTALCLAAVAIGYWVGSLFMHAPAN